MACKFKLNAFHSSDSELSLFLLEEELFPAKAFCRPTWKEMKIHNHVKNLMAQLATLEPQKWLQLDTMNESHPKKY